MFRNKYASGREGALPVELARQAIRALEEKIYKDFGYRVTLGAEQEYTVKLRNTANGHIIAKGNPLQLPEKIHDLNFTPQSKRGEKEHKDPLFPKSPYVAYSYLEAEIQHPYYKYETVISHEAISDKSPPGGDASSRGMRLALAIETLRKLLKKDARTVPTLGPFSAGRNFSNIVETVTTAPYLPKQEITNGLHINVGLVNPSNPDDDKNPMEDPEGARHDIAKSICAMNGAGAYLLAPDKPSMGRLDSRRACDQYNVVSLANYVENKVPGANANPYYAIMITLAGVYDGLKRLKNNTEPQPDGERYEPSRHNKTGYVLECANKGAPYFECEDNLLRQTLNEVQPGLGDELVEAVKRTPPGKEKLPLQRGTERSR